MRRTALYIVGFIVMSSLVSSCVSKKKFEELARAKREVDRDLLDVTKDKKNLEQELKQAKDDFNTIRYKLTENNATKDKTIDGLYLKVRNLESKHTELKSELTDVSDQFKTNTQTSEEQIVSLESSLKKITIERDKFRKELSELQTSLEWENRKMKGELEASKTNMQTKESELATLRQENEEMNKKLAWIRKEKANGDAEVKKLTNQVNLLKKELNK